MPPVLTVNVGSSSIRLNAVSVAAGGSKTVATFHAARVSAPTTPAPRDQLALILAAWNLGTPSAVAHRIVHGGSKLVRSCLIDQAVEAEIERLSPLAPLHNPPALEWVRACRDFFGPNVPQVGVFDTAFFVGLPEVAATYALPLSLDRRLGLKRYGFHGIAHQAMERRWRAIETRRAEATRVISFHLGAGCSAAAVREGRPVDTSMGFSPLEGLVMATRSGDLDPGLLLYLARAEGMTPERLEGLLNEESGLLGLSGMSGDMRVLLDSDREEARRAVAVYAYRARKYLGGYLAVLGGADAILFGGGVGENAPAIREMILADMDWAGVTLDRAKNRAAVGREARIDSRSGGPEVWAVPVDEATNQAEEAVAVLARDLPKRGKRET